MRMIDKKIREYLLPEKILAESKTSDARCLLENNTDQAYFGGDCGCTLAQGAYLLLDFGRELSGGVKLICNECSGNKNARLRIVFGESAMEALSNLGEKGSSNDHAVRDETLTVPWVGAVEFGNTGFRFVRIENKSDYAVSLRQVFAVFVHSDIVPTGTFRCSDERINRIWAVGAYTVFLNMQDYVYDGIKRDRVVWIGDMHPETSAILRLYGKDERVERSLELVRKNTPESAFGGNTPQETWTFGEAEKHAAYRVDERDSFVFHVVDKNRLRLLSVYGRPGIYRPSDFLYVRGDRTPDRLRSLGRQLLCRR